MKTGETRKAVYVALFDGKLYAVAAFDAGRAALWFKEYFKLVGGTVRMWRVFDAYSFCKDDIQQLDISIGDL